MVNDGWTIQLGMYLSITSKRLTQLKYFSFLNTFEFFCFAVGMGRTEKKNRCSSL